MELFFPTISETSASASNGKILRYFGTYPNGSLKWDDTNITLASIGSPTSQTDIYGSPINVNGYPLEFSEDSLVFCCWWCYSRFFFCNWFILQRCNLSRLAND
jgi:hypothetical protein